MEGLAGDLEGKSVCKGAVHFTDWWGLTMADVYISPTTHPLVIKKGKGEVKKKREREVQRMETWLVSLLMIN